MKAFILRQFSLLRDLSISSDILRFGPWLISLMISAYLLVNLSVPLYESSSHKGYIFAGNNDGGRAIEVSMATRWYNSNHFAPYGNLYYRFSQSFADLIPVGQSRLSELETKEKSHHFALKVVSLFSLFSLGIFLGWVYFGTTFVVPLFASLFTLVSLNIPIWNQWVHRPHPEHLLNLFIAIALYWFAKFVTEKNNYRTLIISAFCWGIAMAVKRSTSIFIPGILIILLFPFNKTSFRTCLSYIGYMLLAYLVVGFPQNFGFYKHIKFMLYESSLHSLADTESIIMNLRLVWAQLIYLIPITLAASLFSSNRNKFFSKRILFLVVISFIPILSRKLAFESDHHTMPLAMGCMMLVLIFLIHFLPWRINNQWFLAVLLLIGIKMLGINANYFKWAKDETACYPEFDQITKIIETKISANSQLVKEPYFPSNEKIGQFTATFWGLDWSKIGTSVKFIGITKTSLLKHLQDPPKDYYDKRLLNWKEKQSFYKDFNDQSTVTSPNGVVFEKAFNNVTCDYELWMAK